MITVSLTTKKGQKYAFSVSPGADFLSTLDKFVKRNKLAVLSLKRIAISCDRTESVACRAAKASAAALRFIRSTAGR